MGGPLGAPAGGAGVDPLAAFLALDLSDDQRDRLGRIADDLRKRQWDLQGKVMDRESELRRLADGQRRATKAIGDLRAEMGKASADALRRAREVLTEEQRQRLEGLSYPGGAPMGAPGAPGGAPGPTGPGFQGVPPAGTFGPGPGGARRGGSGSGAGMGF
jgi:hypothetical protein